ncbi:MAG: serine hydrolase [Coriobacteriales bacterium]|jgi:CubicO group peptidase (beta-lactamase class C family)|nr:serine hydrolase [Coriobacteriales bacterium]
MPESLTPTGLQAIVRDARHRLSLPSVAVGVSLAGRDSHCVIGHRAFAVKSANANTVYRLASCSKAFVATALLLLREEGKLSLDQPLVGYLPDFQMFNATLTAQVTARDLLCHRCGLPRHDIANFLNQQRSLEQMVASVRFLEPAYALRERFHYQNQMYGVLSLLIERLSGQPWGQFIEQRILTPLGMQRSHTRCGAARDVDDNFARPLVRFSRFNLPFFTSNDDSIGGAGALSASVHDLLIWARLNLEQGRFQGRQLLPAGIFAELHAPQIPIHPGEFSPISLPFVSDSAYALGWFCERYREQRLIYHGGTIFGYKALVGFMPEHDFAYAVLVNQDSTVACEAIGRQLCDAVLGAPAHDWVSECRKAQEGVRQQKKLEAQRLTVPPAKAPSLAGLAGHYEHPAYGQIEVRRQRGQLHLIAAGLNLVLKPSAVDQFVVYSRLASQAFPCRFVRRDATAVGIGASGGAMPAGAVPAGDASEAASLAVASSEAAAPAASELQIKFDEDLSSYIRFCRTGT